MTAVPAPAHPSRPARPTSSLRRLPAAVLGAGLLAAALATPSAAARFPGYSPEHGFAGGWFRVDGDLATFQTFDNYDPEALRLVIQPKVEFGTPQPEPVTVPFTPEPLIDGGHFDVSAARTLLGEAGHGPVAFHVLVPGQEAPLDMGMDLGPDEDLTDGVLPAHVHTYGPMEWVLDDRARRWEDDAVMAPGVEGMEVRFTVKSKYWSGDSPVIAAAPAHGEAWPVKDGNRVGFWYVPEKGFVGEDTFTVKYGSSESAAAQTVHVHVGTEVPASLRHLAGPGAKVLGGFALDLDDPEVAARLKALRGGEPAPTTPAQPTTPAEPTTPEPSTPAPAPEETGEHTVPDTVETGNAANGWLAGLAAVAAAGLVAGRRRLLGTR